MRRVRICMFTLACLSGSATLGGCRQQQAASAAPVEAPDQTGMRIEYAAPQHLKLAGSRQFEIKSLLNVSGRMSYGEYVWDAAGVPPGRTWVLVDLTAQTMSVFRGANEIGATVLLFGMQDKPTPTGQFTILSRNKDYWSHTYDAPMPYALRLTSDGVAIHGSDVQFRSATHGCLGVPIDFARKLFAEAHVGDQVIVLRDLQSAIS
jgi:L,D-transpeptidase-like protein